jgi:hypothetical protein
MTADNSDGHSIDTITTEIDGTASRHTPDDSAKRMDRIEQVSEDEHVEEGIKGFRGACY